MRVIYERCKHEWGYRIPDAPADQRELRAMCARTLEFENYFMSVFKEFVLGELCGDDLEARQDASWLLGQIPYHDEAIIRALRKMTASAKQEKLL